MVDVCETFEVCLLNFYKATFHLLFIINVEINQLNYSYDKVEELGGRGELGEEG